MPMALPIDVCHAPEHRLKPVVAFLRELCVLRHVVDEDLEHELENEDGVLDALVCGEDPLRLSRLAVIGIFDAAGADGSLLAPAEEGIPLLGAKGNEIAAALAATDAPTAFASDCVVGIGVACGAVCSARISDMVFGKASSDNEVVEAPANRRGAVCTC